MITLREAYNKALKTGWTQELEDIIYNESADFSPYKFNFSIDIVGANLVRYINCYNSLYYALEDNHLYNWINILIEAGVNYFGLIPAIKDSDLKDTHKDRLIRHAERALVRLVIL